MPVDDQIKIFDSDDKSLKLLGELLSNDTSRRIIKLLIEKESYTNEISTKLDIRVSLVIHHLKKLEELGLLEINHKQIVKKGNNHRYFRMIPGLFLAPSQTKEEIENSGFLKKIFREGIKFASVIFLTIFTLKVFSADENIPVEVLETNDNSNYSDFSRNILEIPVELSFPFELTLLLLPIIGLGLYFYLKKRKN